MSLPIVLGEQFYHLWGATWNRPTSNIYVWILIRAQPKRQVFKTKTSADFIAGSVLEKYLKIVRAALLLTLYLSLSLFWLAKISFNIFLLNLAVRIIPIFLLIDLFVFSSWWWMFDRYISIIDRKMSNTNEYLINRFTSIVWKNSIVRQISIIKIVMVAPQRACRPLRDNAIE